MWKTGASGGLLPLNNFGCSVWLGELLYDICMLKRFNRFLLYVICVQKKRDEKNSFLSFCFHFRKSKHWTSTLPLLPGSTRIELSAAHPRAHCSDIRYLLSANVFWEQQEHIRIPHQCTNANSVYVYVCVCVFVFQQHSQFVRTNIN
jgi:hypothetical protein